MLTLLFHELILLPELFDLVVRQGPPPLSEVLADCGPRELFASQVLFHPIEHLLEGLSRNPGGSFRVTCQSG